MQPKERKNRASLVSQIVKNLPAMQETQVRALGWGDPLEKGMNLNKLWEILRTGEPGILKSMRLQRVRHDLVTEQQQRSEWVGGGWTGSLGLIDANYYI